MTVQLYRAERMPDKYQDRFLVLQAMARKTAWVGFGWLNWPPSAVRPPSRPSAAKPDDREAV